MTVSINGTSGIVNDATDLNYTGTLTGGTGVVNLGSGQVYKDASGNVGIGTSSPIVKLHVATSGNTPIIAETTGGATSYLNLRNTGGQAYIAANNNALVFAVTAAATEAARIDSSGNLLVGATASANSTYSVATFRGSTKGIAIQDSSTGNYRAIYGQSGQLYFFNGSNEGYLSSAGAWINASDARLKNSVTDIKYGLSAVLGTQPRSYKMNDLDGDYIGFVAQELQAVIPEAVSGNPEKQLGVDYGSLVAVAFKAIQEQQTLIEQQSAALTALTARITALEGTAA